MMTASDIFSLIQHIIRLQEQRRLSPDPNGLRTRLDPNSTGRGRGILQRVDSALQEGDLKAVLLLLSQLVQGQGDQQARLHEHEDHTRDEEVFPAHSRKVPNVHQLEDVEGDDHQADRRLPQYPLGIVLLVIDEGEIVLLDPVLNKEEEAGKDGLQGLSTREEQSHGKHHQGLGSTLPQVEGHIIHEGLLVQVVLLCLLMLEHLDPQHELVADVKKEHAIRDETCLDSVDQETKAVHQILSQVLGPGIYVLSGEVFNEG